jgi:hypothetical protein
MTTKVQSDIRDFVLMEPGCALPRRQRIHDMHANCRVLGMGVDYDFPMLG